jgi:hypothetical protein
MPIEVSLNDGFLLRSLTNGIVTPRPRTLTKPASGPLHPLGGG